MKKPFVLSCLSVLSLCMHAQTYKEVAEKAFHCVEADSLDQAVFLFREALKMEPANAFNAELFAAMGEIYRQKKDWKTALDNYTLSLSLCPNSVPVLLSRASAYMETGDDHRAYTDYCDVLDLDKNNREALFFRAYLNMEKRDFKAARIDYDRLLQIEPNHDKARMGLAILNQKEGRLKEAYDQLSTLIAANPGDASLYASRADVEKDQGAYGMAILDMEEAIRLKPDDAQYYVVCAGIYLRLKKKKPARNSLDKAVELGVSRASLHELYKECR